MAWRGIERTVPKDSTDENQDAARIFDGCIAMADGTSSGFDSGRWARSLVRAAPDLLVAFRDTPLRTHRRWRRKDALAPRESGSVDSLGATRARLLELQLQHAAATTSSCGSAYLEEARQRGASSTYSLAWLEPAARRVLLFAIGDSCWVIIRGNECRSAFPYASARDFPDQPRLVFSEPQRLGFHSRFVGIAKAAYAARLRHYSTTELLQSSPFDPTLDRLLGCTDAVAQWLLVDSECDRRHRLSLLLDSIEDRSHDGRDARRGRTSARLIKKHLQKQKLMAAHPTSNTSMNQRFAALVDEERKAGRMRRDDSTVVLASWRQGPVP